MSKTEKDSSNISFDEEQYRLLEKLFPVVETTPSMDIQTIMYQAGQQNVMSVIRKRVRSVLRARLPHGD